LPTLEKAEIYRTAANNHVSPRFAKEQAQKIEQLREASNAHPQECPADADPLRANGFGGYARPYPKRRFP
jgi:hypothetical protein